MPCFTGTILAEFPYGIKLFPLPCKRWSCPDCCEKRKNTLRNEAYRGLPNTFITLTVNPETGANKHDRARRLVVAWRKIRRRASKGWNNVDIPFIAVFETTAQGEPHLHILCRSKWIDQAWLSDEMLSEIGAPIVDIRRIKSKKAAALYVSKYIGKDPEHFEGCKRYWRSINYLIVKKKSKWGGADRPTKTWFLREDIEQIIRTYTKLYYRVEHYESEFLSETWLVDSLQEVLSRNKKHPETLALPSVGPPQGHRCGVARLGSYC